MFSLWMKLAGKRIAEAIMEAVNAGIKLIMTTHGESLEEIRKDLH